MEPPGPFREGTGPSLGRTREEILGEPLSKEEVRELVAVASRRRRQLDLGNYILQLSIKLGLPFYVSINEVSSSIFCIVSRVFKV